jgi:hypothetical protein
MKKLLAILLLIPAAAGAECRTVGNHGGMLCDPAPPPAPAAIPLSALILPDYWPPEVRYEYRYIPRDLTTTCFKYPGSAFVCTTR